ncbi:MAG TPA: hypothetical protein VIX17_21550 [Pyrinomonadaceae bacterium]
MLNRVMQAWDANIRQAKKHVTPPECSYTPTTSTYKHRTPSE